jgi:hypothetical protein
MGLPMRNVLEQCARGLRFGHGFLALIAQYHLVENCCAANRGCARVAFTEHEQIRNKRPGWKETELKQQLTQSAYKSEHNYHCEPEPWKASKAERSQSRT